MTVTLPPLDPRLAAMLRKGKGREAPAPREKPIRPTPERLAKPDLRPCLVDRYAKRAEITKTQAEAAAILRRDYWIGEGGQLMGRLVATYEPAIASGSPGSYTPPTTAGESRAAYLRAIEAVGPELAGVLHHVVILDEPAASWAEVTLAGSRSTNAAAGLAALKLALCALVRHYGLGNPR